MSAPKKFIITCGKCRWKEMSTGISADLAHLHEYQHSCMNCGRPREFRCPRCGDKAKLLRVKGQG